MRIINHFLQVFIESRDTFFMLQEAAFLPFSALSASPGSPASLSFHCSPLWLSQGQLGFSRCRTLPASLVLSCRLISGELGNWPSS